MRYFNQSTISETALLVIDFKILDLPNSVSLKVCLNFYKFIYIPFHRKNYFSIHRFFLFIESNSRYMYKRNTDLTMLVKIVLKNYGHSSNIQIDHFFIPFYLL